MTGTNPAKPTSQEQASGSLPRYAAGCAHVPAASASALVFVLVCFCALAVARASMLSCSRILRSSSPAFPSSAEPRCSTTMRTFIWARVHRCANVQNHFEPNACALEVSVMNKNNV